MRSFSVVAALALTGLGSAAVLAQEAQPPAQPPAPAPTPAPTPPPAPTAPTPAPTPPAPAPAAQPKPAQPTPAPAAQPKPAQPTPAPAAGAPAPAAGAPAPAPAPGAVNAAKPATPATPPPPQWKPPAKMTSVCPGKVLPLAVGNEWTYEQVQAVLNGNAVTAPESMKRLIPMQPTKVVVSVTGVETKGAETTVKLTEKISYDITRDPKRPKLFDETVESTIVCNKTGKFDISPDSFFFAGEPGGFRGLEFTKIERKKETSLKLTNNVIGETEWIEEIAAEYQKKATPGSNAKLGGGKLEIERKFTPQPLERISTKLAIFRTERLGLTTTGRIMLDGKLAPDGKPCVQKKLNEKKEEISVPTETCELPANWLANIWLADSVGVVQTLNPYAHMFQLVDVKLN